MILRKIILAALIVTSAAFADFFNVGARAAANFGTAWGDDAKDATWGAGFNAGVALKIDILPVITIIPGLEVDYRRIGEEENYSDGSFYKISSDETYGLWYLDVPVLAWVKLIPLVYFNAGVQFSFNLSATLDYDETETSIKTGESKKTSDDKSYSKFINTMDENDEGFKVSMKHMRMQTGIIYWF